jgi:hypothetical protein
MPEPATTSTKILLRVIACVCAALLVITAALLSRLSAQRAELAAQATRATLAEQESRGLRQQLEAERILSAAQSRMLRDILHKPDSIRPPEVHTNGAP